MNRSALLRSVLWQLFFQAASIGAFLGSTPGVVPHITSNGRYFVQTGILPPLAPVSTITSLSLPSNDTSAATIARVVSYSDVACGNVPVTYTNNPRVVDEWLCRNIPYDGCVVGFDIEVSGRKTKSDVLIACIECSAEVFRSKGRKL
jgi:hypothetical protein